jgi:hypothetical protein
MKFAQLQETAAALLSAGLSVLVSGPPGIGKSALSEEIARRRGWRLVISHPVTADPTDFKGLPLLVDGRAEFLPFGDLLDLLSADTETLWHVDDLIQAPTSVQAALMQLVHPNCRQLNGRKLSPRVRILASTNRRQDRAGGMGFIEPLKQRFVAMQLDVDPVQWTRWALQSGISPYVATYLRWRPQHLLIEQPTPDLTGAPNPRSWEWVSRVLGAIVEPAVQLELAMGLLGPEVGTEFISFLRVADRLPDLALLAVDPDRVPVPTEPDSRYAAIGALIGLSDQIPATHLIRYLDRFPEEFQLVFATLVSSQGTPFVSSAAFADWIVRHQSSFGIHS